jgi:hypothetical protein
MTGKTSRRALRPQFFFRGKLRYLLLNCSFKKICQNIRWIKKNLQIRSKNDRFPG